MSQRTKRCAVYLRVSTDRQTVENQAAEVTRLAEARGHEPVVFEETESAAKARPVLDRLLVDVRAGRVHAVAVWALDRLSRSMTGAICTVLELDRLGVPVLSVREGWLDTSRPVRPILVAVFGWVAERERTRLIERTRAGLDRARRQGRPWGAPAPLPCSCWPPGSLWRPGRAWRRLPGPRACPAVPFGGGWPKTPPWRARETALLLAWQAEPVCLASNGRFRPSGGRSGSQGLASSVSARPSDDGYVRNGPQRHRQAR